MGFFSSRKAEDNDGYVVPLGTNEKGSVVQVIRSRFVSLLIAPIWGASADEWILSLGPYFSPSLAVLLVRLISHFGGPDLHCV